MKSDGRRCHLSFPRREYLRNDTTTRGRRDNVALFCNCENTAIHVLSASLESLIATHEVQGVWNGSTLQTANHHLFASLFFCMSGEGDRESSPPFSSTNAVMSASSALLEALIASLLPTVGTTKEATFLRAIKLLIAIELLFACANGEWETALSCALIGTCNALL